MRDHTLYLKDILGAMEAIERFVEGMEFDQFKKDDKTSSAVIRNKYPEIPWKEMAGMRDKLIHFYFGIKYELVWKTIKDVIPRIKPVIHQIVK